jgi:MFS family permease
LHISPNGEIVPSPPLDALTESAPPDDPSDPLNWPTRRKWIVTAALSATGFNRIMVSTIMAPPLPVISRDLSLTEVQSVMALSIYVLATAFSPLIIGPLSETLGRTPLLHASNL